MRNFLKLKAANDVAQAIRLQSLDHGILSGEVRPSVLMGTRVGRRSCVLGKGASFEKNNVLVDVTPDMADPNLWRVLISVSFESKLYSTTYTKEASFYLRASNIAGAVKRILEGYAL